MPISNSLTVEVLNQAENATHNNVTLTSSSSSKSCEEKIVASGVCDLSTSVLSLGSGSTARPHIQYLDKDCLIFRVSEDKTTDKKPWLVDPMLRRSDLTRVQSTTRIL